MTFGTAEKGDVASWTKGFRLENLRVGIFSGVQIFVSCLVLDCFDITAILSVDALVLSLQLGLFDTNGG